MAEGAAAEVAQVRMENRRLMREVEEKDREIRRLNHVREVLLRLTGRYSQFLPRSKYDTSSVEEVVAGADEYWDGRRSRLEEV